MNKRKIYDLSRCAEVINNLDDDKQTRVLKKLLEVGKSGISSHDLSVALKMRYGSLSSIIKNLATKGWLFEIKRVKGSKSHLRFLVGINTSVDRYPTIYPYTILKGEPIKCNDCFMFKEQLQLINQVFR